MKVDSGGPSNVKVMLAWCYDTPTLGHSQQAFFTRKENKNLGPADFVHDVPIFGCLFVIHNST